MKNIAGIIAEYNPFHNGHAYQLQQVKKAGAEGIVICMSGNYVQRCEPALLEKHRRAEIAVKNGADLVFELPFPYHILSAEAFASAGVRLLSSTGVVSSLYFGGEEAEIPLLEDSYRALCEAEFSGDIPALMKSGMSFPRARAAAMKRHGALFVPEKPNDILAFEYCKAIQKQQCSIRPVLLRRIGDYHAESPSGNFLSASGIRSRLAAGEDVAPYLPENSYRMICEAKKNHTLVFPEQFDPILFSGLFRAAAEPEFLQERFVGISEGLQNRVVSAAERCIASGKRDFSSLCKEAGTKRYTDSAIRRAVYSLFFRLHAPVSPPSYLHVLAFNEKGRTLLRMMKDTALLPVFHTLPAASKAEYQKAIEREIFADNVYALLSGDRELGINGYTANSVFIENL